MSWNETKKDAVVEWLLNNISDQAPGPLDYEKGFADNVAALNNSFGYGYLDPDQHLQTILDSVKFPIRRDPSIVFTWIDRQMAVYSSCGGVDDDAINKKILDDDAINKKIFLKGLTPEAKQIQVDFWMNCRVNLKRILVDDILTSGSEPAPPNFHIDPWTITGFRRVKVPSFADFFGWQTRDQFFSVHVLLDSLIIEF
jgi:hypothetical protein